MDTRFQGDRPKDDLLVSWKDLAAYLKCSVRKAQRLEQRGLPVNRIPGTKSVWALKSEIDRWLTWQAEKAKHRQGQWPGGGGPEVADAGLSRAATFEQTDENSPEALASGVTRRTPPQSGVIGTGHSPVGGLTRLSFPGRLWVLGMLLGLTIVAAIASAYGLTIIFFLLTAVFVFLIYPSLQDAGYTRAAVGLFMLACMSYGAGATTLPDVIGSVINMRTLRPALAYPFVTGLRFIPIPVLISILVVVLTFRDNMGFARNPGLRKAYLLLGALFLFVTAMAGLSASGAHRIWQSGLSIRWTLLAGESFVFAVNVALFLLGYRFFNTTSIKSYQQLLSWYGTGYLLIALTAAIVDRHWNEINKYHLDTRRPHAYRVQNTNAANDLQDWLQHHSAEAGPDLMSLSNDPEFLHALRTQEFYKQDFDEALQVSSKAVIFGYKSGHDSRAKPPIFVLIRFPADLAAALRFELVTTVSLNPS